MDILYPRCAGLDVHKESVSACRLTRDPLGQTVVEIQKFSTMTVSLLSLSDWLSEGGCTHVAMESTGVFWKPIYAILEGQFELVLANPAHMKAVPGRKTDIKDAQWIAELLQLGLLNPSFVPPAPQRALRDLTRCRTNFVRERAKLVNQVQKLLEEANIKLACVATDVMGKSGRAMLEALVEGETDPHVMADMAKGRLRNKLGSLAQALDGRVKPHQRLMLEELLCHIDQCDASIARMDAAIEEACTPFREAVELLDTIPGISQTTAELIVAEVGADMSRFPSANHLGAWAGVAPGNHESAGKRLSGRCRQGNKALKAGLVQAAHAAAHTKQTYLSAQFRRIAAKKGKKRAAMAVAHSMLVIAYHVMSRKEPYRELGGDYFDKRRPDATVRRLTARLEKLGYGVTLELLTSKEPLAEAA